MIDERTVYNYNRLSVCAKLIRLGNCIGTIVRLFCKTSVCWFSVTTTKMKARQVEFIVSYCNKHSSSRPISAPHRLIKQKAQQGGSSLPPARTACCGLPATKITRLQPRPARRFLELQKVSDLGLDLGSGQDHIIIHNTCIGLPDMLNHLTAAAHTTEIWPFEYCEISTFVKVTLPVIAFL